MLSTSTIMLVGSMIRDKKKISSKDIVLSICDFNLSPCGSYIKLGLDSDFYKTIEDYIYSVTYNEISKIIKAEERTDKLFIDITDKSIYLSDLNSYLKSSALTMTKPDNRIICNICIWKMILLAIDEIRLVDIQGVSANNFLKEIKSAIKPIIAKYIYGQSMIIGLISKL